MTETLAGKLDKSWANSLNILSGFDSGRIDPVSQQVNNLRYDMMEKDLGVADRDLNPKSYAITSRMKREKQNLIKLAGGNEQDLGDRLSQSNYDYLQVVADFVFPDNQNRAKVFADKMRGNAVAAIVKADGGIKREVDNDEIFARVPILTRTTDDPNLMDLALVDLITQKANLKIIKAEAEEELGKEAGIKKEIIKEKPAPKAVKTLAEILNKKEIGAANVDILLNALPQIKQNYDLHGGGSIEVVKELMKLSNVNEKLIKDHPELVKALSNLLKTRKVPSGIAGLAEKVASNQNHFRELQSIVRGEMLVQRSKLVEPVIPEAESPTEPAAPETEDGEALPDWLKDLQPPKKGKQEVVEPEAELSDLDLIADEVRGVVNQPEAKDPRGEEMKVPDWLKALRKRQQQQAGVQEPQPLVEMASASLADVAFEYAMKNDQDLVGQFSEVLAKHKKASFVFDSKTFPGLVQLMLESELRVMPDLKVNQVQVNAGDFYGNEVGVDSKVDVTQGRKQDVIDIHMPLGTDDNQLVVQVPNDPDQQFHVVSQLSEVQRVLSFNLEQNINETLSKALSREGVSLGAPAMANIIGGKFNLILTRYQAETSAAVKEIESSIILPVRPSGIGNVLTRMAKDTQEVNAKNTKLFVLNEYEFAELATIAAKSMIQDFGISEIPAYKVSQPRFGPNGVTINVNAQIRGKNVPLSLNLDPQLRYLNHSIDTGNLGLFERGLLKTQGGKISTAVKGFGGKITQTMLEEMKKNGSRVIRISRVGIERNAEDSNFGFTVGVE